MCKNQNVYINQNATEVHLHNVYVYEVGNVANVPDL